LVSGSLQSVVLAAMHARGVRMIDVARGARVHRNVLGRWLAGTGTIRLDQFERVCVVLGLVVDVRSA